jgi:hypothetical protein
MVFGENNILKWTYYPTLTLIYLPRLRELNKKNFTKIRYKKTPPKGEVLY